MIVLPRRRALGLFAAGVASSALGLGCHERRSSSGLQPAASGAGVLSPNARPPSFSSVATREGRGAMVQRLFPTRITRYLDPFVLLDDFSVEPPAGFPMHPHRGFEAFTYMIDGSFEHKDTMGNESVVSSGGTQRFTSGRGARHSEMPVEGRPNRGMQLWVNLPRRLKQMSPTYEAVHGRDLPEDHRAGTTVRTVVGPGSPVQLQTEVSYRDLTMAAKSRWESAVDAGHQALLYVAEGRVRVGDVELARGEVALPSPGEIGLLALADARVFLVSGRPHGEPIRHHGPFVD